MRRSGDIECEQNSCNGRETKKERQPQSAHLHPIQAQCVSAPELRPGLLLAELQQAGQTPEPERHQDLAVEHPGPIGCIGSRLVPRLTAAGCRVACSRGTRPHLCDGALCKSQLPREVAAEEAGAARQASNLIEDLAHSPSALHLFLFFGRVCAQATNRLSGKQQGSSTML